MRISLWALLTASCTLSCSATLDLDHQGCAEGQTCVDAAPTGGEDAETAPNDGSTGADDGAPAGDAAPTIDARPPPPDAFTPECRDEDGDGYGEGCAAGPDCRDNAAAVHPEARERCNAVDDDCDEQIDEGFELGAECGAGAGACRRLGQMICGLDGARAECSTGPGGAAEEICNEVDDDCDGAVDEGVSFCCEQGSEVACGAAVGACRPGIQVCDAGGVRGPCSGIGPSDEICNEIDDDCDGRVDEGLLNACGECGDAPAERCNNVDDDCDARVDEGVQNACGGCGAVPPEVCDGADQDCDRRVDEGVANPCGGCGAAPIEVCNGADDDCDGDVDEGVANACGGCGPLAVEVCNGEDDDCDGEVDEVRGAGEGCEVGVGNCRRAGERACADGALRCDASAGDPSPEECNGEDDDCDRAIDEGEVCPDCAEVELCNGRDDDCDDDVDEGVRNACGGCGAVPDEVCNDDDDDCDGQTDEGFGVGEACTVGEGACLAEGEVGCEGRHSVACMAPVLAPGVEACNGVDDDCDGASDEGVQNACGACGPAPRESCDEADNDCDGQIDENFDFENDQLNCGHCGRTCDAMLVDSCQEGRCVCSGEGRRCLPGEVCEFGRCMNGSICPPEDPPCIEP